jgi:nitrous oxidase accessory protein NosD
MSYVIQYDSSTDKFKMNGWSENFIGSHFEQIAKENNIDPGSWISESHALFILRNNDIEVDLLEEDGSPLDY